MFSGPGVHEPLFCQDCAWLEFQMVQFFQHPSEYVCLVLRMPTALCAAMNDYVRLRSIDFEATENCDK